MMAEFSIIEIVEMIMADGHDLRMRLLNKYHARFTLAPPPPTTDVKESVPETVAKPAAVARPGKWTEEIDAEIAGRRGAGESCKSMALAYGSTEKTIWNRIYAHKQRVRKMAAATKQIDAVEDEPVVPPSNIPEKHKRQALRYDFCRFLKARGRDIEMVKGAVVCAGVALSDDALLVRVNSERNRLGLTPTTWSAS
ncbi:MAG: hypothetical protein WBK91_04045 [Alphaproteobacteria bacterium]